MKDSVTLSAKSFHNGSEKRYVVRDEEVYYGIPVSSKDFGEAMTPMEGLLATLAGCKVGWVVGYAENFNIKLQNVEISCKGEYGELEENEELKKGIHTGFREIRTTYNIRSKSEPKIIEEFISLIDDICIVGNTLITSPKQIFEINISSD